MGWEVKVKPPLFDKLGGNGGFFGVWGLEMDEVLGGSS